MIGTFATYEKQDIQMLILESVSQLDKRQKMKLLDFINSSFLRDKSNKDKFLQYAGFIKKPELEQMKLAIKDSEKIDYNEW